MSNHLARQNIPSPPAGLVLNALEQAVHERRPAKGLGPVHHSDRGSRYLSIRYTERLAEAGIEPSFGSAGDSYDNALAETIDRLFLAEVIHRRDPWRSFEDVERVDWFNNRRPLEPIGSIPPTEAEATFYAALGAEATALPISVPPPANPVRFSSEVKQTLQWRV